MNWPEFVQACEVEMRKANVDPEKVTVRVEVSDSYYDANLERAWIYVSEWSDPPGKYLIFFGG